MNTLPKRNYLIKVRQILAVNFNEGELRTLCFDLGIDYDSLPATGKSDKARELIAYCERHSRLNELVAIGKHLRPNISWEEISKSQVPDVDTPSRPSRSLWQGLIKTSALLLPLVVIGIAIGISIVNVQLQQTSGQVTATAEAQPTTTPQATVTPTADRPNLFCDSIEQVPKVECEALVALYNNTEGVDWKRNDGWMKTTTACSWYGITCGAGHVVWINLSDNQLSGTIPRQLSNLTNLEILNLSWNQLSGPIPPELENLTRLRELYFWVTNGLSGPIPPELGNLVNLEKLDISVNQLSGTLPPELGRLTKLRHLSVHQNLFTGSIPPELGNLVDLRELYLSANQLRGPVPSQFGNLTNLQVCRIDHNGLSGGLPPELTRLTLQHFSFQNTNLCEPRDTAFQEWLKTIPDLTKSGVVCP